MLIVDGGRGEVIVDPDADTLAALEEQRNRQLARAHELRSKPLGVPGTLDGVRMHIGANIEVLSEISFRWSASSPRGTPCFGAPSEICLSQREPRF
jgi:phosphoenolpyruvate-protein kinase (PTS system EI component)